MIQHIKLIPFLFGLVIGIIGVLCIKMDKNIIYKYPTPNEADQLIYKDKNGVCYRYKVNEVQCDQNESRLKSFPLSK